MTAPIRIWTCAAHSPVYRCGGWAAVRISPGATSGLAGGERGASAGRTALLGLVAALRDLPGGGDPIRIQTTSPELAAFAGFLASLGEPTQAAGPEEDLDLWAQIAIAAKGRRLSLAHTPLDAGAPSGFVSAWADLALDKVRNTGAFASAIPKANLGKIPGLDRP